MILEGKVKASLGNDIASEAIASSKYIKSLDPQEMAQFALRDIDPAFPERMRGGGFLVAGRNFGCASSREWAPLALKACGVRLVIAESFARIFYRSALSIGLPLLDKEGASKDIQVGDELRVNLASGLIENLTRGQRLQALPIPPFLLERIAKGGLIPFLREELGLP